MHLLALISNHPDTLSGQYQVGGLRVSHRNAVRWRPGSAGAARAAAGPGPPGRYGSLAGGRPAGGHATARLSRAESPGNGIPAAPAERIASAAQPVTAAARQVA